VPELQLLNVLNMRISHTRVAVPNSAAQSAADAVLADKIPLPAASLISVQWIDFMNIFGSWEGLLDFGTGFVPALRES
jgi:hypothetical protein